MSMSQNILRSIIATTLWQFLPNRMHRRRLKKSRKWVEIEEAMVPLVIDPNRVAVDVGAHTGRYTALLARAAREVLAFEPDEGLAAYIAKARYRNVTVYRAALSNACMERDLFVPVRDGRAALALASLEPEVSGMQTATRRVRATTLDTLAERDIGFVKIDVEGHELSVLRGARKLIERQKPLFLVEAEDRHRPGAVAAVREFFAEFGYSGFFIFGARTHDISEIAADMVDTGELMRPVDRRAMRYVNNFFFAPSDEAAAHMRSTLDAALLSR
jgi:FkbM family methyltransferase